MPARIGKMVSGVLVLLWLVLTPTVGLAHPDFGLVNTEVTVPANGFITYPMLIHFHRLVGTVDVTRSEEGRVSVLVLDEAGLIELKAGRSTTPYLEFDHLHQGRVNALIPCCGTAAPVDNPSFRPLRPDEFDYTKMYLLLRNEDPQSDAHVRLSLKLIHDDAAVSVYGAETGHPRLPFYAGVAALLAIAVGAAILVVRRQESAVAVAGPVRRAFLALTTGSATLVFGAASVLAAHLSFKGMTAYGGGVIDGLVAVVGDLHLPEWPFGGHFPVLYGILLIAWLLGVFLWLAAFLIGAGIGSRWAGILGMVEGAATLLVGVLTDVAYGPFLFPVLAGVLVASPLLVGGAFLMRPLYGSAQRAVV